MEKPLTIREMQQRFGVTARTLRFYEEEGMIAPLREGQHRLYRRGDQIKLKLILRGRNLGFSLSEVRKIMELYDAEPGELGQIDYLIERIGVRRAELLEKRRQIDDVLAELDGLEANCRADRETLAGGHENDVRKQREG
ncbi:MAG: MerR family DNA-binding transcriptional regulator [Rhodovibrionaceae bacterium]